MTTAARHAAYDLRDFMDGQASFYAGTANVVMQLGRPAVGYGVYESKVDSGNVMLVPRKRARTTLTYLAVALLGTDEERAHLRSEVNRQHVAVRSTPESPVEYNAFDPDLQLWVGACLAYGARDAYARLHGEPPPEIAEWLYQQTSRLATTLQVPEDRWPPTLADFEAYWSDAVAHVSYDDTIKGYVNDLLDLKQLSPRQQRKLAGFHRWVNTGFLPPAFREAVGLAWSAEDEAKFERFLSRVGERNRRRPRVVRNFPINYFLWNFRARKRLGIPIV